MVLYVTEIHYFEHFFLLSFTPDELYVGREASLDISGVILGQGHKQDHHGHFFNKTDRHSDQLKYEI